MEYNHAIKNQWKTLLFTRWRTYSELKIWHCKNVSLFKLIWYKNLVKVAPRKESYTPIHSIHVQFWWKGHFIFQLKLSWIVPIHLHACIFITKASLAKSLFCFRKIHTHTHNINLYRRYILHVWDYLLCFGTGLCVVVCELSPECVGAGLRNSPVTMRTHTSTCTMYRLYRFILCV